MQMMILIQRWRVEKGQQRKRDEIMQMNELMKAVCGDGQRKKRGRIWFTRVYACSRNQQTTVIQQKYIHPPKQHKTSQPIPGLARQISPKCSNPPKATTFLPTSSRSSLLLAVLQFARHASYFCNNVQGRNINYYQYQFRHMNTDESISLSTSQNIAKLDRNHFLIKGDATAYFKEEVIIDFEPVKAIDPFLSPPRLSSFSIIPTFNQDSKYYTLAFINPFDADQEEEDDKIRTQHETRVKEYSTQIAEKDILMPKPRHSDPFCGVCRQGFADYLEHINSSKHENKVKKSRFSKFIVELGDDLFPKVRKSRRLISKGRK